MIFLKKSYRGNFSDEDLIRIAAFLEFELAFVATYCVSGNFPFDIRVDYANDKLTVIIGNGEGNVIE